MAVDDFNGDSVLDLVTANYGPYDGDSVAILLGNGDGTYRPGPILRPTGTNVGVVGPTYVASGDLNHDGHPDLAISKGNEGENNLVVFLATSDSTFERDREYSSGVELLGLAIADMNQDGDLDVVTAGGFKTTPPDWRTTVWLGDGHGGLDPPIHYAGNGSWGVAVGDLNGDSRPDVVTTNFYASWYGPREPSAVSVMLGQSDGTLGPLTDISVPDWPYDVEIADVNADGHPDLVTANFRSYSLSVLLGHGDGTFGEPDTLTTPEGEADHVAVADVTGDGKPDLVTTNLGDKVSVFPGKGDGTFGTRIDVEAPLGTFDVIARDLNGDGRIDVATTDFYSKVVSVFVNTGCGGSQEPITGVFPNRGGNGGDATVAIYGCGFEDGATAKLTRAGQSDIVGNPVSVSEDGVVTAVFDLEDRALGPWNVEVLNPEETSPAERVGGFTIELAREPVVTLDVAGRTRYRPGSPFANFVSGTNSGNNDFKGWSTVCIENEACVQNDTLKFKNCKVDPFPPGNSFVFTLPWTIAGKFSVEQFYNISGVAGPDQQLCPEGSGHVSATVFQAQIPPADTQGEVSPGAAIVASQGNKEHGHGILYKYWQQIGRTDCLSDLSPGFEKALQNAVSTRLKTLVDDFTLNPCADTSLAHADVVILRAVNSALGSLAGTYPTEVGQYRPCFDAIDPVLFRSSLCNVMKDLELKKDTRAAVTPNWMKNPETVTRVCGTGDGCDPNEKLGPVGVGPDGFIANGTPLNYTVYFENDPEISDHPAAEVSVTDHLDPLKVDLSTFTLGPVTFGKYSLTPVPGSNPWIGEKDLRPDQDLIVRVVVQLDTESGLLTARFQALEPSTGLIPTDPDIGFLPPNTNPPDGEGSISFTVMPRTVLNTDTRIANRATLVFGRNAPISTPEAVNTIDGSKPSSEVNSLAPIPGSERVLAGWSGFDPGSSGIGDYLIYVSDNGAPYTLWRVSSANQDTFPGQDGHTYGFYSIARDRVGNQEDPPNPLVADTTWTVALNRPPMFTSVSSEATANEGASVNLSASATDADAGQTVTVSPSGFPASLTSTSGSATMPDTTSATVSGILGDHDGDANPTFYKIIWTASDGLLSARDSTGLTVYDMVPMEFAFRPGTLNLRSMGHWVTGYLEPPAPFTPAQIDTPTIRLNGGVPVDPFAPVSIGDFDGNGIPDLAVKFDRVLVEMSVSAGDSVPMTVTGSMDGHLFKGSDYVRVIHAVVTAPAPGAVVPAGGVTTVHWTTPTGVSVQSVALLSSTDDGGTWTLDGHELPNTGSADWIAPSTATNQAKLAIVLVESADETGYIVDGVLGTSGTFTIGNITGVEADAKVEFALRVVRPNPTQENLRVTFGLPEARAARLEVFNVSGRLVASREVGSLGVGFHTITLGQGKLASGVYLVRLTQGAKRLTTRAVLVR